MKKNKPELKEISTSPGIYKFISESGVVLYVGKAKNLRNRIKSYYQKNHGRGPRIDLLLKAAEKFETIETDSEIEAILLEAELIKKLKPRFNVSQKDDKSFLVVEFSKDKYPALMLTRMKEKEFFGKSMRYSFGPYPSGDLLKKSLKYLRKLFPYRDCSESKFSRLCKKGKNCLYGDINLCGAPCTQKISETEYKKQINYLKDFLKGNKKKIIGKLNKEMQRLSKNQKYEEAAIIRNKIYSLEHLREVAVGIKDNNFDSSKIIFKRIECFDISNISGIYAVGAMSVFESGSRASEEYRKFKIKTVKKANDVAMIAEIVKRRFGNSWPHPDLIVIDGGVMQLNAARLTLSKLGLKIPIVSIAKGSKRDKNEFHYSDPDTAKYIKATPNLQQIIIRARDEAHRFAVEYYRLLHKKGMLGE